MLAKAAILVHEVFELLDVVNFMFVAMGLPLNLIEIFVPFQLFKLCVFSIYGALYFIHLVLRQMLAIIGFLISQISGFIIFVFAIFTMVFNSF